MCAAATKKRVAVIGAGAAGLCAVRQFSARPEQFIVSAFEQTNSVGGTWVYTERVGTDQFGLPVHSSMYRNMRTNLPKEVMAFPDFPFREDLHSFIHHTEVYGYLRDYAEHFHLNPFIKFQTAVETVFPVVKNDTFSHWLLTYKYLPDKSAPPITEEFDAIVVCNGHYSVPLIPDLPGLEDFRGLVTHSHDFRTAHPFKDMTVICLGAKASGMDISIEISKVAKKVLLSHNLAKVESALPGNLEQVAGIERVTATSAILKDGTEVKVDAILFCTGYRFSFPFLAKECGLQIVEERMTPLYKHMILTTFPSLFFVGMCKIICPFPQFHCQMLVVISVLDGTVKLPSKEEMDNDTEADFQKRMSEGLPVRHAHLMATRQWGYNDELAAIGKFKPIDGSIQLLYDYIHATRVKDLMNYKELSYKITGPNTFAVISGK